MRLSAPQHIPSLRDSRALTLLFLGLKSEAIVCRAYGTKRATSKPRFALGLNRQTVKSFGFRRAPKVLTTSATSFEIASRPLNLTPSV